MKNKKYIKKKDLIKFIKIDRNEKIRTIKNLKL